QLALGNLTNGVEITNGAGANLVGGTTAGVRNIISGNQIDGVLIGPGYTSFSYNLATSNNSVQGNFIGTDFTGAAPLGNKLNGVELSGYAAYFGAAAANKNLIGGNVAGAGNLISANGNGGIGDGILLGGSGALTVDQNTIAGNFIGTNLLGTAAL